MLDKTMVCGAIAATLMAFAVSAQADVFNMPDGDTSLQFVTVGDPGNAADPATGNKYGSVSNTYRMGKYDVTVGQYCQFLNAVATTSDPYGLYNSDMAGYFSGLTTPFGITQSVISGSYSYSVTGTAAGVDNFPAFCVTWGDAARFCNWLQNGQPNLPEGNGTTETGAYSLNGGTSSALLMAVTRNVNASYFIPTADEWYKAAYYNPSSGTYWAYSTASNTAPGNTLPDTGNNAAWDNGGYTDPQTHLTPVGSFVLSPGPYGTYDMGGDIWQWNESSYNSDLHRGIRGGSYNASVNYLSSSESEVLDPTADLNASGIPVGFRVASEVVPEPGSIALLLASVFSVLAFAWRRRRRAV